MDPRSAVQRLLELQQSGIDSDALEQHLDDTAFELLAALCGCLSFALASNRRTPTQRERVREQIGQCVGAINMVLEVWQMGDVEIVDEPYLDEYALGWMPLN
jgi:hypothetical protein